MAACKVIFRINSILTQLRHTFRELIPTQQVEVQMLDRLRAIAAAVGHHAETGHGNAS